MKTNRLIKVRTLRGRLTALYLAVLVVALGLFTALLHGALETTLYRHHDPELAMEAARLSQAFAGPSTDGASVAQAINQTGSGSQFVMVRSRQEISCTSRRYSRRVSPISGAMRCSYTRPQPALLRRNSSRHDSSTGVCFDSSVCLSPTLRVPISRLACRSVTSRPRDSTS